MDHKDHDKVFFANFGVVMAALFGIFFICIIAASMISSEDEPDPAAIALVDERTRPVAQVVTDPQALLKVSAAAATQRAPLTGEQLNSQLCAGCHMAGVLGAPKSGDRAAWSARRDAAGGIDGLVSAVVNGKGAMPPKAGDPSLSEDEIRGAVEFMLKEAGV